MLAISALASLGLAALIYRRFADVVRSLSRPAQAFADGDFSRRISVPRAGPDVARLVANLNAMFGQTERLISQLQALSTSIAHDLRTPLTRAGNYLQVASDGVGPASRDAIAGAERELDTAMKLLQGSLHLAEIQSGKLQSHFTPLDLGDAVLECMDLFEPIFTECGIAMERDVAPTVMVNGSADLLKRLVVNLFENTLAHNKAATAVKVTLSRQERIVRLHIEDCAQAAADHGDVPPGAGSVEWSENQAARQGGDRHGFGLAFVRAIAELHRAQVHYGPTGRFGFFCTLELPALDGECHR